MRIKNRLHISRHFAKVGIMIGLLGLFSCTNSGNSLNKEKDGIRQRISINEDWSFFRYDSASISDNLIYDVRPEVTDNNDNKDADSKPTEAVEVERIQKVLKSWILPSGNDFIKDSQNKHVRPEGNPGSDFPFVQSNFNDSSWEKVDLPHDWAIKGPFQTGWNSEVGGGMGRLPSNGVAWYRKKLDIPASDAGKSIFLDVDGAMSYAMVWLNGNLVGGWPYGYNSWRVDLTPFVVVGGENQLAIRLDNPNHSARWYPGGGIYRNVWLTKTNPVHVGQWGTYITTNNVSSESATVNLEVSIDNDSKEKSDIEVITEVFTLDDKTDRADNKVATFPATSKNILSAESIKVVASIEIINPKLWGPFPTQTPNRYIAITTLLQNGKPIDRYETRFGIRSIEFNPEKGIFVNGERIQIKGVNQHHDLGALGAAFNTRAAERQLEILREMGCNAIRMSHNPPAPELLELTDRMGFLVIDEIFDSWERKKTPHDFHLIFPDWSEPDTRAFIRRDRNCPSVIMWSFGNEVGEQYTGEEGAAVAKRLHDIIKEEDSTRPTTLAMNFAKPDMALPQIPDVIGLNYQGEGIRQTPEFEGTDRIRTAPQYDAFHAKFPDKVILSSETASAFSSRGIYLFPVTTDISSPTRDGRGGDSKTSQVSSYELYAVDFGSSADKVFGSIERHPFIAGEFVWTGWDYIGEPTPYYEARSSYTGIIDLAGFKKDRFYLYQSHWRPEFPMVHILPHWNWPERIGEITPVHVFTSGDEAELFLNGKSLGKKKKAQYEYRLRWDNVVYEPGELKVVAYKHGKKWAEEVLETTGEPAKLKAKTDRDEIHADGKDLAFITIQVSDENGLMVPRSNNPIDFSIEGPGEIVATDNGNPYDLVAFPMHNREAFNGLALVIVRSKSGEKGTIKLKARSTDLTETSVEIQFSFCLNTSTISGQRVGFLKEFEIVSKAGYDGIEIWIRDIQKYIGEGGNLKDLKKYIDDLGLKVENAIGFAEWIVDDEAKRNAGSEQLKKEMDLLAQIGCKRIAAPSAGKYSEPITDWFEVADRYRKILEIGDNTGVTPQLEFWGASAGLFHISQAMFIATAANHPKASILPDIYHMFRGGSGYDSLKQISGSAIEVFHFNDFVSGIPREKQTDSDRVYPGDGAAPYQQIITDLYNAGGKKVFSLELFNESYWKKDALEVATTGLNKMKKLVDQAMVTILP